MKLSVTHSLFLLVGTLSATACGGNDGKTPIEAPRPASTDPSRTPDAPGNPNDLPGVSAVAFENVTVAEDDTSKLVFPDEGMRPDCIALYSASKLGIENPFSSPAKNEWKDSIALQLNATGEQITIKQVKKVSGTIRKGNRKGTHVACSFPSQVSLVSTRIVLTAPEVERNFDEVQRAARVEPQGLRILGGVYWNRQERTPFPWVDYISFDWYIKDEPGMALSVSPAWLQVTKVGAWASKSAADFCLARSIQIASDASFAEGSWVAHVPTKHCNADNTTFRLGDAPQGDPEKKITTGADSVGGYIPVDPTGVHNFDCVRSNSSNQCGNILSRNFAQVLRKTIDVEKPLFVRFAADLSVGARVYEIRVETDGALTVIRDYAPEMNHPLLMQPK